MSGHRDRAGSLSSTLTISTSGSFDGSKTKPLRPRLSPPHKRVSFDAVSVPLPSVDMEEMESPVAGSSNIPPPTPIASVRGDRLRANRKTSSMDSVVDLKAVLAAGIDAWRTEIAEAEVESEES